MSGPPKKYGLTLMKKSSTAPSSSIAKKKSIFDDSDDEDTFQPRSSNAPVARKSIPIQQLNDSDEEDNEQTQQEITATNIDSVEDSTVFQYDEVYDATKLAQRRQQMARDGVRQSKQARYVPNMVRVAEDRKMQEIRIQESKYHRELQAELEANPELDINNMQTFVTSSYRKQQEELRAFEQQQHERDEEDKVVTGDKDFVRFGKNILEARIRENMAVQEALANPKALIEERPDDQKKKSTGEEPKLTAGLNILRKPKAPIASSDQSTSHGAEYAYRRSLLTREEKERLEKQVEQEIKRHAEEQKRQREQEEEELKKKWQRQTTDDKLSDARRRFEERRKARAFQTQTTENKP